MNMSFFWRKHSFIIEDYVKAGKTRGGLTFMQFLPGSFAVVTFVVGTLQS